MSETDDELRNRLKDAVQNAIAIAYSVARKFAGPEDDIDIAARVSVLGTLVAVTEVRCGAEGVDALVEAMNDVAPLAKQVGRQARKEMN